MKRWMAISALGLVLAGCGGSGDNTNNLPMRRTVTSGEVEKATKDLSKGKGARVMQESNNFGLRLLASVLKAQPDQNCLISPVGISVALSMAYNGASGTTKAGMDKALGFEGLTLADVNSADKQLLTMFVAPDPKVRVDIANSLWAKSGVEFKRDFLGRVQDSFGAPPTVMDFKSADAPKQINAWVAQATQDKITELVKAIPEDTALYLINAVYFKGFWKDQFDPRLTEDRDFTAFDGKKSKTKMMARKGDFDYFQSDKVRMVRLPYGSGRLGMLVILGPEGGNWKGLQKELSAKNLSTWKDGLKPIPGTIILPRFKAEYQLKLNDVLKELGMGEAFTDKADFSGMREPNDLYIKEALHKTFIEVNEEGTEAAAATKIEVGITSAPMPSKEFMFIADRPFYYAIEDKTTGVILFLGVYGDPK